MPEPTRSTRSPARSDRGWSSPRSRAIRRRCRESSARSISSINLAAAVTRRELLDLSRHYYGPRGQGTHQAGAVPLESAPAPEASDEAPAELERWCAFHEGVARLPAEEREVVGLIFYHGWSQKQVAELLQVTDRTVRRWWESALVRLRQAHQEGPAT